MNQIPLTQQINNNGTPLAYYNGQTVANNNPQQGSVCVSTPSGQQQIYSYPTTSLYDPNTKQATSGVNIYIYNPSGIGGQNAMMPQPQIPSTAPQTCVPQAPIANTSLDAEQTSSNQKKKKIVELTDEYIKSLENYLRNNDPSVRRTGIIDLIKRYEEDSSRYDDPALTALLNIALQDPKTDNRVLAMSVIAAEQAHGDQNTISLLQNMQSSDKLYNQERKMALEAALKSAQNKMEVIDNDPPRKRISESK